MKTPGDRGMGGRDGTQTEVTWWLTIRHEEGLVWSQLGLKGGVIYSPGSETAMNEGVNRW